MYWWVSIFLCLCSFSQISTVFGGVTECYDCFDTSSCNDPLSRGSVTTEYCSSAKVQNLHKEFNGALKNKTDAENIYYPNDPQYVCLKAVYNEGGRNGTIRGCVSQWYSIGDIKWMILRHYGKKAVEIQTCDKDLCNASIKIRPFLTMFVLIFFSVLKM